MLPDPGRSYIDFGSKWIMSFTSMDAAWVADYEKETGESVSFFWLAEDRRKLNVQFQIWSPIRCYYMFYHKAWLSSPTMHGDEAKYMMEAYETNWMSTVGQNINEVERQMAEYIGVKYAVALSAGTAALHLAK